MGEAKRRRLLGFQPPQRSKKAQLNSISPVPNVFVDSSGLISTKITVPGIGNFKVSLGKVLSLKNAPEVHQIAIKSKVVKFDRWYSPCSVENSAGSIVHLVVFYAPPYSNVKIGMVWLTTATTWSQSEVKAIETPVRQGIISMLP